MFRYEDSQEQMTRSNGPVNELSSLYTNSIDTNVFIVWIDANLLYERSSVLSAELF